MDRSYGSVADTAPEGFLSRRIHFSTLVTLDTPTKEGMLEREIAGSGFSTRTLPLPIDGLGFTQGHMETEIVGRLDKITISGTNVEGWGWAVDDENGRKAYRQLELLLQNGNSIVMADVKVKVSYEGDPWDDDFTVKALFSESALAKTTLVATPAFANARADLEDLTASLAMEGDLEVTTPFTASWAERPDLTAAALVLEHEAFTVPEPDHHQPITVSRDGRRIFGHLGLFGQPHTGLSGLVTIPRSRSNYAHYCKSGPFHTEKGKVFTGPLILIGGHEATLEIVNKALADPANAWADVVVHDGKLGPWVCGVTRPGLTQEALHAATGSRISGHWRHGELFAICSVNAEGYDVPRATEFQIELDDEGEPEYLAASFALGLEDEPTEPAKPVEVDLTAALRVLEDDDADEPTQAST